MKRKQPSRRINTPGAPSVPATAAPRWWAAVLLFLMMVLSTAPMMIPHPNIPEENVLFSMCDVFLHRGHVAVRIVSLRAVAMASLVVCVNVVPWTFLIPERFMSSTMYSPTPVWSQLMRVSLFQVVWRRFMYPMTAP